MLFAVVLGALLLGETWPTGIALAGALLVMKGILAFAWVIARPAAGSDRETKILRTDKGA